MKLRRPPYYVGYVAEEPWDMHASASSLGIPSRTRSGDRIRFTLATARVVQPMGAIHGEAEATAIYYVGDVAEGAWDIHGS